MMRASQWGVPVYGLPEIGDQKMACFHWESMVMFWFMTKLMTKLMTIFGSCWFNFIHDGWQKHWKTSPSGTPSGTLNASGPGFIQTLLLEIPPLSTHLSITEKEIGRSPWPFEEGKNWGKSLGKNPLEILGSYVLGETRQGSKRGAPFIGSKVGWWKYFTNLSRRQESKENVVR